MVLAKFRQLWQQ